MIYYWIKIALFLLFQVWILDTRMDTDTTTFTVTAMGTVVMDILDMVTTEDIEATK